MAGERRLNGDLGGFAIAHLTDHDDVRILAQDGAQGVGKAQADLGMNLDLVDTAQLVLHRVFHGDDLGGLSIELAEGGIERGGLARAGGAGNQQDAVGPLQQ